jgi:glutamine amidotransferase
VRTALIDYGASNLHSVFKALDRVGLRPEIATNPAQAQGADAMVLPGQGHFGQVMDSFLASGLEPAVRAHLASERPFLGICVGLQLLMEGSEEAPDVPGLGLLAGTVRRFPDDRVSVPQMGWNQLTPIGRSPLLEGVPDGSFVNFANSYYVDFAGGGLMGAHSEYGGVRFLSAVSIGPVHATQFHPEKSQGVGLTILGNFRALVETAATA